MAKIQFIDKNFRQASLEMIETINGIIDDYLAQNYKLTVRQLYYQLVSKDIISNKLSSYKRIAALIDDGKKAGLIDWYAIEDRTREFITKGYWGSPREILESSAYQYHENMWDAQSEHQVYVIIEKEALVGILEKTCKKWDVPLLAARGYPSGTVLFEFFEDYIQGNRHKQHIIIHLGDHDPSGLDMTRDLSDRINMFSRFNYDIKVERIALNYDQIEELNPPKNPAKDSDARFENYKKQFGESSWELDALSPSYINEIVEFKIEQYVNIIEWEYKVAIIDDKKEYLRGIAENYGDD